MIEAYGVIQFNTLQFISFDSYDNESYQLGIYAFVCNVLQVPRELISQLWWWSGMQAARVCSRH